MEPAGPFDAAGLDRHLTDTVPSTYGGLWYVGVDLRIGFVGDAASIESEAKAYIGQQPGVPTLTYVKVGHTVQELTALRERVGADSIWQAQQGIYVTGYGINESKNVVSIEVRDLQPSDTAALRGRYGPEAVEVRASQGVATASGAPAPAQLADLGLRTLPKAT